jgi:hypothetical protein
VENKTFKKEKFYVSGDRSLASLVASVRELEGLDRERNVELVRRGEKWKITAPVCQLPAQWIFQKEKEERGK